MEHTCQDPTCTGDKLMPQTNTHLLSPNQCKHCMHVQCAYRKPSKYTCQHSCPTLLPEETCQCILLWKTCLFASNYLCTGFGSPKVWHVSSGNHCSLYTMFCCTVILHPKYNGFPWCPPPELCNWTATCCNLLCLLPTLDIH